MSCDEKTALLNSFTVPCYVVTLTEADPSDDKSMLWSTDLPFALSLEELLYYKDDPWWQLMRRTLLYSIWLLFLLTFMCACLLSYGKRDICLQHSEAHVSTMNPLLVASSRLAL